MKLEIIVTIVATTNIFEKVRVKKNAIAPGVTSKAIDKIMPIASRLATIMVDSAIKSP